MHDKSPSLIAPVVTTAAALLDLGATFLSVAEAPGQTPGVVLLIFAELGLLALATGAWVFYFKKYVQYVLGSRLDTA